MILFAPPAIMPPALVQIAQSAAGVCPRLAPAETLEDLSINLLSDFKCKLDIKHPLAIPKNSSDGRTTYAFHGTQFFQIIIPSTSKEKIGSFPKRVGSVL